MWTNGPFLDCFVFGCKHLQYTNTCNWDEVSSFRHLAVCAHIISFNFNLHAFRCTDALQPPNSHMVHKHLARAQTTKWTWVLERREICLVHDVVVVLFLAMLKEFLS